MNEQPAELYLQTHDDDGDEVGEITFCYDNVYRCDTRYVRADIADDLYAALKCIVDGINDEWHPMFIGEPTFTPDELKALKAAEAALAKAEGRDE